MIQPKFIDAPDQQGWYVQAGAWGYFNPDAFVWSAFSFDPHWDTTVYPAFQYSGFQSAFQLGQMSFPQSVDTTLINAHEFHNPVTAFNKTVIYGADVAIDQSMMYLPYSVYNLKQMFEASVCGDESVVYNPFNVYNTRQIYDASVIDQSQVYFDPYAFNLKQIINVSPLIDVSAVFDVQSVTTPDQFFFTPEIVDLNYPSTTFQMHMDGVNDGTVFSETHGKAITRSGVVTKISTSVSGGSSAYFPASDSYLYAAPSADYAFGTGDFTIEMWVNFSSLAGTRLITNRATQAGATGTWSFRYGATWLIFSEVIVGEPNVVGGYTFVTGRWYHIAVSRASGTLRLFVDGKVIGSGAFTNNLSNSSYNLWLGCSPSENYFGGFMDDVRITKGVARYTANFNPSILPYQVVDIFAPTAFNLTQIFSGATAIDQSSVDAPHAFNLKQVVQAAPTIEIDTTPVEKYTQALIPFEGGFPDWIGGTSATLYGSVATSTSSKSGSGAAYFDGVDDGVTYSYKSGFSFEGDFTVEFWVKPMRTSYSLDCSFELGTYTNGILFRHYIGSSYGGQCYLGSSTGTTSIVFSAGWITVGEWQHIAIVRSGSTIRFFRNGVLYGSTLTLAGTVNSLNGDLSLGRANHSTQYGNAYIDDFRITKYARYSANFTPPAYLNIPGNFAPLSVYNEDIVVQGAAAFDQSTVYAPADMFALNTEIVAGEIFDISTVYAPDSVFNSLRYFDAAVAIDQGEIYPPFADNWIKYLSGATAIDQSTIYNPLSVWNTTQFFVGATAIDQSFVQTPTAFNLTQIFSGATAINQSHVHVPDAYNIDRYFAGATAIDQSSVYNPTAQLFTQKFTGATAIDQSSVYNPHLFNLKQIFTGANPFDQSSVHSPVADNADRTFSAATAIDQSTVYNVQSVTLLDITYYLNAAIDQSTVYSPTVYNKKQVFISSSSVNFSSIYSPSAANSDTVAQPTLISDSAVYSPTAELVNKTYEAATIAAPLPTVFPLFDVTYRIRTYTIAVPIDDGVVYSIESVFNINQQAYPTLISDGVVYNVNSIENRNRTFTGATAFDQSTVYSPETAGNLDRVFTGATAVDQSSVYNPSVTNYYQFFEPIAVDQSTVYNPTLTLAPQANPAGVGYTGEVLNNLDLTTYAVHRLFPIGYVGEEMFGDVALTPAIGFTGIFWEGATGLIDSLAEDFPGLSNAVAFDGAEAFGGTMTNEPHIYGYTGETVYPVTLVTESILQAEAGAGEALLWSFDTHESQPLYLNPLVDGSQMFASLVPMYAGVELVPHAIRANPFMAVDFDYPFILDLTQDCACSTPRPFVYTNLNFEFGNEDSLFKKYDGEKQYMWVELACQKYFTPEPIQSGQYAYTQEPNTIWPGLMFDEKNYCEASLNLDVIRHRLCKGNFVANGSNVPIELTDALDETCEEHRMYTGESMEIGYGLSTQAQFLGVAYHGSHAYGDLTIYPPIQVVIHISPNVWADLSCTVMMWPLQAADGEVMYAEFYNPTHYAYTGEYVSATLVIEYGVEFTESGSLNNEHVIQLPDGSIDTIKTTTIPIELYYFRHDLKARCF